MITTTLIDKNLNALARQVFGYTLCELGVSLTSIDQGRVWISSDDRPVDMPAFVVKNGRSWLWVIPTFSVDDIPGGTHKYLLRTSRPEDATSAVWGDLPYCCGTRFGGLCGALRDNDGEILGWDGGITLPCDVYDEWYSICNEYM